MWGGGGSGDCDSGSCGLIVETVAAGVLFLLVLIIVLEWANLCESSYQISLVDIILLLIDILFFKK